MGLRFARKGSSMRRPRLYGPTKSGQRQKNWRRTKTYEIQRTSLICRSALHSSERQDGSNEKTIGTVCGEVGKIELPSMRHDFFRLCRRPADAPQHPPPEQAAAAQLRVTGNA